MFSKNQKGFTIIETLVAVGILSIIFLSAMTLFKLINDAPKKTEAVLTILKYKKTILSNLQSSDTLASTASHPENVIPIDPVNLKPCLITRQNCGNTGWEELSVYDRLGNVITKRTPLPLPNTFGFGIDGKSCTSYPSISCPFQFIVEWKAICDPGVIGSCATPQIKIKGKFNIFNQVPMSVNTALYSFETTLGQFIGSYEQGCASLGGVYIPGDPPQCKMPFAGACPTMTDGTKQVVVGFDTTPPGSKICKAYYANPIAGTCPPGQVMVAITPAGVPTCKVIVAPTTPAQPIPFCDANPFDPACTSIIPADPGSQGFDGGCGAGGGAC